MPRALTPCAVCFRPTTGSRCPAHGGRTDRPDRPTATQRGYDADWRRVRRRVRDRWIEQHGPLCPGYRRPPHRVDPAELEVDHVIPLADGGPRLDPANLRPLCKRCNSAKRDRTR